MVRIVDWQLLLNAIASNWVGFEGRCGLVLTDPLLSATPRATLVMGSGGQPKVEKLEAARMLAECPDFVSGDIHAWSSVADGFISAEAACSQGLLQPSTSAAARLAAQLFPSRSPFLPQADHF